MDSATVATPKTNHTIAVTSYDLAATLDSGQAFRWQRVANGWEGVIDGRWVRLEQASSGIRATALAPTADWTWVEDYLQTSINLNQIISTFPTDEPMRRAVAACRGLRLLRQDTWECLASFILSSTKQIAQIRQIVKRLCERYGDFVGTGGETTDWYSFPEHSVVASLTEKELRDCGMGFRAPYLLNSAKAVQDGSVRLEQLNKLDLEHAREIIMRLPGVGRKIADCVLLFTGMQPRAFPVDVWIMKALQQLYFPNKRRSLKHFHAFSDAHFGPNAGYAQQYLFHYMRTHQNQK